MPVPKKRHSRSRQGKRRANWRLKHVGISTCPSCGAAVLPHHACRKCGAYKGMAVIELKEKLKDKKKARASEVKKQKDAGPEKEKAHSAEEGKQPEAKSPKRSSPKSSTAKKPKAKSKKNP